MDVTAGELLVQPLVELFRPLFVLPVPVPPVVLPMLPVPIPVVPLVALGAPGELVGPAPPPAPVLEPAPAPAAPPPAPPLPAAKAHELETARVVASKIAVNFILVLLGFPIERQGPRERAVPAAKRKST